MSTAIGKLPIGERVLPALIDEYAHFEPYKVIAVLPADAAMNIWHKVTYRELKHVVDYLAWDIEKKIGRSDTFETLVYMGANDIRYMCFWAAAWKCGYSVMTLSPRNSPEEQRSLLGATSCTRFFYSNEMSEKVEEIKNVLSWDLKSFLVPSYTDLVAAGNATDSKPYPFTKTYEELADKPAFIFHTSGTTGMPKPITLVHFYFAAMDNLSILPVPEGRQQANWTLMKPGDFYFNGFPPFHPAGANFTCWCAVHTGTTFVSPPAEVPLNEDVFLKVLKHFDFTVAMLPPSFIEDIADSPNALEAISKVRYVFSMAGPLGLASGDKLSQYTQLVQLIGSTEAGLMAGLVSKSWRGFEWNPYYGDDMELIEGTETYERTVRKDPKYAKYHAVWSTFPDIKEWRTRDLFVRDPEDPNFWTFLGRTDDVIVLSNGEKVQPVALQTQIQDHRLLKSAVVVGQGKFQVGLIIEPDWEKWDSNRPHQELIDEVWPAVEKACRSTTATGRIFKNMIMVAKKEKPFPRAGKGTVLRAKTIIWYKDEIEDLYAKGENIEFSKPLPDVIDESTMKKFVRDIVTTFLDVENLQDDDHFFSRGLDSLQTLGIAKALRSAVEPASNGVVKSGAPILTPRSIYQNPSIDMIATLLLNLLKGTAHDSKRADSNHGDRRETQIETMVQRYTSDIPDIKKTPPRGKQDDLHVIITGTTGSLGPYLLHNILSNPKVSKVYCLNRSPDARWRTEKSFSTLKLPWISTKAEFLTVNFSDKHFGLDDAKYQELLENVDLVFHNAWALNFNYTLETFEISFVKSVSELKDFSLRSAHAAHLFFISSIGTVGGWKPSPDRNPVEQIFVPESVMYNSSASIGTGYGESKHVSERILAVAAQKAGVPVSIARLGQIAGPTTTHGKWNDAEWLPRIVKTSKTIRRIPETLGTMVGDGIDWIPVDLMAAACAELGFKRLATQENEVLDVFHLENPNLSQWSNLLPAIQKYFEVQGCPAEVVPYNDWLEAIQRHADTEKAATADLPVLSMLEYYQAARDAPQRVRCATSNAQAKSKVIANLKPIGPEAMVTWLEQWAY